MDLYNLTTKIPYVIMMGIGIVIILQLFVGGLNHLSIQINEASLDEYDKALAAEEVNNLGGERGIVPVEYFKEQDGTSSCSHSEVNRIDGKELAYSIYLKHNDSDFPCTDVINHPDTFQTRILLQNENSVTPATVFIYEP